MAWTPDMGGIRCGLPIKKEEPMNDEVREAMQVIHDTPGAVDLLVSGVLDNGAKSAMRSAIGDRTPRQYDKADEVAEGIARGVRSTVKEMAGIK